ncbi:MAG: hypothetical protein M0R41_04370 [Methylobacter tundripaludum]|nr:hypothetical protein [Methylobacter tundripaludum]
MHVTDAYVDKYVAFLDLLGFKSKVNDADTNPEVRKELLNVLDILRDTLCNNDKLGMRFTHFSDCIIFTANRTFEGLWEILESINVLTVNLLNYDFLVRGGLVVGGAHHDENFVYGLAVNKAYEIESKKAVFPMTLVSNEVIDDVKSYGSHLEEFLTQDADGRYFVHYLKSYAEYRGLLKNSLPVYPVYPGEVILEFSGRRIVDFICHRLNTHTNPQVLEKNTWFQNYWNDKVAVKGIFGRIEAGVTERDLGHAPTIIKRRILKSA